MKAEDCIFYQITKTAQYARKAHHEKGKHSLLTLGQTIVLAFLFEENGITINDLAEKTVIDNATMTGIIDRLEEAEIIERRKSPTDRRAYLIHLTPKGKSLSGEIQEEMAARNKDFLSVLTKTEELQFRDLLKKVRRQI